MKDFVFLGGTCNNSSWRDELIPMLKKNSIAFFNPVVKVWNEEAYQTELKMRKTSKVNLFYLDVSLIKGVFSIFELCAESIENPQSLVVYVKYSPDPDHEFLNNSIKKGLGILNNKFIVMSSLEDTMEDLAFCIKEMMESEKKDSSNYLFSCKDGLKVYLDGKQIILRDYTGTTINQIDVETILLQTLTI